MGFMDRLRGRKAESQDITEMDDDEFWEMIENETSEPPEVIEEKLAEPETSTKSETEPHPEEECGESAEDLDDSLVELSRIRIRSYSDLDAVRGRRNKISKDVAEIRPIEHFLDLYNYYDTMLPCGMCLGDVAFLSTPIKISDLPPECKRFVVEDVELTLMNCTVATLKDMAKSYGVKCSGNKSGIVECLRKQVGDSILLSEIEPVVRMADEYMESTRGLIDQVCRFKSESEMYDIYELKIWVNSWFFAMKYPEDSVLTALEKYSREVYKDAMEIGQYLVAQEAASAMSKVLIYEGRYRDAADWEVKFLWSWDRNDQYDRLYELGDFSGLYDRLGTPYRNYQMVSEEVDSYSTWNRLLIDAASEYDDRTQKLVQKAIEKLSR